ncbi:Uncharacterized protein dnm_069010 [Desulfonema magnum]|uniref:Uncharacterized protein n=1 Tax=Desulfonema magnum TaxID=45655 RepID=A0A975GRC5_9BACT|nr:Uncharacterized protein dnm_069010 [Desulfonema magnum]
MPCEQQQRNNKYHAISFLISIRKRNPGFFPGMILFFAGKNRVSSPAATFYKKLMVRYLHFS